METNKEIAKTILAQIGREAMLLLGAKELGIMDKGLVFKVSGASKASRLAIILEPSDTYKVVGMRGTKRVHEVGGIFADALHNELEAATGLYVSFHKRA